MYKPVSTILNKVIKVVDRKGNNKVNKDGDEGKHLRINEEAQADTPKGSGHKPLPWKGHRVELSKEKAIPKEGV